MSRVRIIGPGRAGRSFAIALAEVGHDVEVLDRDARPTAAGRNVDAVLIATPDRAIRAVAQTIDAAEAVVMHCSGATGLDALRPHERVASLHPLTALPGPEVGAERLRSAWFAVAGDPIAARLARDLGGRSFEVPDDLRTRYHATAAIAANHLVALLAQVERLATSCSVPLEAFLDLAEGSLGDVRALGARAALTGPAERGDSETVDAHRRDLPPGELDLYDTLAAAAARLAHRRGDDHAADPNDR